MHARVFACVCVCACVCSCVHACVSACLLKCISLSLTTAFEKRCVCFFFHSRYKQGFLSVLGRGSTAFRLCVHTCARVCAQSAVGDIEINQKGRKWISLSLSHTHTHTHTLSMHYLSLCLSLSLSGSLPLYCSPCSSDWREEPYLTTR